MVTLDLSVSVLEAIDPDPVSRAFPNEGEEGFEPYEGPASVYESLRTLRVVIVRPSGKIEHNRLVMFNPETNLPLYHDLTFKVAVPDAEDGKDRTGETKTIYLFGNEKLVSATNNYDFSKLKVGENFPAEEIAALVVKMNGSAPVIDNSTGEIRTFVPMSESFDIYINYPGENGEPVDGNGDYYRSAHLFLTRSLIKFSFNVKVDTPFSSGVKLSGIEISGLANESYYLPKETVYKESTNPPGLSIDEFLTPDIEDKDRKTHIFPLIEPFDMSVAGEREIVQYAYFPETKGSYKVRLLFDGKDMQYMTELLGSQDLEIKEIPRNTHVKVNISFNYHDIECIVDLLPYTGVTLEPEFGF